MRNRTRIHGNLSSKAVNVKIYSPETGAGGRPTLLQKQPLRLFRFMKLPGMSESMRNALFAKCHFGRLPDATAKMARAQRLREVLPHALFPKQCGANPKPFDQKSNPVAEGCKSRIIRLYPFNRLLHSLQ